MEMGTLTAAVIAELAFKKFLESGAGELAKQLTASTLTKMDELRKLIWQKLQGKPATETALAEVEKGKKEELNRVVAYLQVVIDEDGEFAQQVKTLAGEIQQEIHIAQQQGRNVQNVFGGEGYQVNEPKAPTIQGVEGSTINITYGNPPDT